MAMEAQGMFENWKRVWRIDEQLQGLTRSYAQKVKESTRELNRLWKVLRVASVDLYLALGGHHPDAEISGNTLQNEAVVALLAAKNRTYLSGKRSQRPILPLTWAPVTMSGESD